MAKRSAYDNVAIDVEGNALSGIQVTVYQSDGVTPATIYGSKGGSATTNPQTTNTTGLVQFWAEPGEYVLVWHDPEIPARVSDRTTYFEAVSGDTGGIDGPQIEDDGITAVRIGAGEVGTSEIATDGVGTAEIAANAVGTAEIANDAVITDKLSLSYEQDVYTGGLSLTNAYQDLGTLSYTPVANGTYLVIVNLSVFLTQSTVGCSITLNVDGSDLSASPIGFVGSPDSASDSRHVSGFAIVTPTTTNAIKARVKKNDAAGTATVQGDDDCRMIVIRLN